MGWRVWWLAAWLVLAWPANGVAQALAAQAPAAESVSAEAATPQTIEPQALAPLRATETTSVLDFAASGLSSPRLYHFSQGLLASAAAFDMTMTVRGITHPPVLRLTVVNNGLTRTVDLDESAHFREGGWARVVSPRNPVLIVAAYAATDALLVMAARRLAARGPQWRAMATMMLLAQSFVHIQAGSTWIGVPQRLAAPYAQFNPVWQR